MTDKPEQEQEQPKENGINVRQLLRCLDAILAPNLSFDETLQTLVREASSAVGCDHLFLSRYDPELQIFKATAWHSSMNPGSVTLEKKFMGTNYLENKPVIVNDLSQYNYRLRPEVARLGLLSMVGVPFLLPNGMLGVLEAFSAEINRFSNAEVECLTLFAKQAALVIGKDDLEQEYKLKAAEYELLAEALKLEHASVGSLLYKMGETFAALFGFEGIAVFGVDSQVQDSPVQEVMAQGFAMADIGRLKTLFSPKFLNQLMVSKAGNNGIFKHTLQQPGSGGAKLLYIVPIAYKQTLFGIFVFFLKGTGGENEMGQIERFINRVVDDVTVLLSRKHLYSSIQKISFSDMLTGLANRRLFDYVLDRELKRTKRSQNPVSLLMIDIDLFKNINDSFGHPMGDQVLEQLGALIRESCRYNVDLPARYGGEEFAIVLPDTNQSHAATIAERLRTKVAASHFLAGSRLVNITISIGGVTYCGPHNETLDTFVAVADQALYHAKWQGRNTVVFARNTEGSEKADKR